MDWEILSSARQVVGKIAGKTDARICVTQRGTHWHFTRVPRKRLNSMCYHLIVSICYISGFILFKYLLEF